jgi:hypothetical protein
MISKELKVYHKLTNSPTTVTLTEYGTKGNNVIFEEAIQKRAFEIITKGLLDVSGPTHRVISPQCIQSVVWDK